MDCQTRMVENDLAPSSGNVSQSPGERTRFPAFSRLSLAIATLGTLVVSADAWIVLTLDVSNPTRVKWFFVSTAALALSLAQITWASGHVFWFVIVAASLRLLRWGGVTLASRGARRVL